MKHKVYTKYLQGSVSVFASLCGDNHGNMYNPS